MQTALVIVGGDGVSQAIRLAGNLVLTRLLVPEYFGLMAITNVVLMALGLFSDIGIGPGVIRSTRGLEPAFINTAWTMQVMRGVLLWILTLLAGHPAALFYEEPLLELLIPVIGTTFVISGFNSMSQVKLNKELKMAKVVIMQITSQIVSLLVMILLAFAFRNVWALVAGNIVGSLIQAVWSHALDRDVRHGFVIDKGVFVELFHFGKWIFLSTAMMFLATQADRLMLGKLFPLALLGVYSIAAGFAELPRNIVDKISGSVIFPLISLYAHLPRPELREKLLKKRKVLLYPAALLVALFTGFGDVLIDVLYDPRYREAGWILPLLAGGMWPLLLYATMDRCLYVVDNPRYPAFANLFKFLYMLVCLPLAYTFTGKLGAVIVISLNNLPAYLVINYGLGKKGMSATAQDLYATAFLTVIFCLICWLRYYFGFGITGFDHYVR